MMITQSVFYGHNKIRSFCEANANGTHTREH